MSTVGQVDRLTAVGVLTVDLMDLWYRDGHRTCHHLLLLRSCSTRPGGSSSCTLTYCIARGGMSPGPRAFWCRSYGGRGRPPSARSTGQWGHLWRRLTNIVCPCNQLDDTGGQHRRSSCAHNWRPRRARGVQWPSFLQAICDRADRDLRGARLRSGSLAPDTTETCSSAPKQPTCLRSVLSTSHSASTNCSSPIQDADSVMFLHRLSWDS
jgi:hypothetical protein